MKTGRVGQEETGIRKEEMGMGTHFDTIAKAMGINAENLGT